MELICLLTDSCATSDVEQGHGPTQSLKACIMKVVQYFKHEALECDNSADAG